MTNRIDYESMSVFEQIKTGLEQSLACSRGELSLKTSTLPAPPAEAGRAKVVALRKKSRLRLKQEEKDDERV